jgi:uncharacterized membrane protein
MNAEPWAVGMIIVATVLGAFGSIYLKKGAEELEFNLRKLWGNVKLLYGVLLYGLSSLFFIVGLKGGELSVLYPLVALSYVWICILSKKILKEEMGLWKWAGVALIVAGVGLIGFGSSV